MATILGANGNQGGYEIDHSYMIDSAAACGLARFGNNSRNGDTFTISFWVKRAKIGTNQILVCSKAEDSGSNAFVFQFTAADKIQVIGQPQAGTTGAGANRTVILSDSVYRDPSAWYHIVYRQDTTQGTAGNRHKLYVNGFQQELTTNDALDQNTEFLYFYNAGSFPYAIGNDERDNLFGDYYMAEHHYTDGVSNAQTEFGEFNSNGVWVPKFYQGSHGTYGHYLKFDNVGGGSGTTAVGEHNYTTGSSSTIGADSSGNDHHFHVQGFGAKNHTEDTPTNNFCTMNPLDTNSNHTLNEGNLKVAYSAGGGTFGLTKGTMGVSAGKWYWEVRYTYGNAGQFGFFDINDNDTTNTSDIFGNVANFEGLAWRIDGSNNIKEVGSSQNADSGMDFASGNILGIAFDADNGKLYGFKNGAEITGQDIANGTSLLSAVTVSDFYLPFISNGDGGSGTKTGTSDPNFGNHMYDISSAQSDANGHGTFEYAVPSGYFALCSKNLAEHG
jgi:hypothetical protein